MEKTPFYLLESLENKVLVFVFEPSQIQQGPTLTAVSQLLYLRVVTEPLRAFCFLSYKIGKRNESERVSCSVVSDSLLSHGL